MLLTQANRLPLGGGTLLSNASSPLPYGHDVSAGRTTDAVEVVDLQAIGLDTVKKQGNNLEIGATVTLQKLLESEHCPQPLQSAIKLEAPLNIRNAATVAGTLVTCDGRSSVAAVLLALDAKLEIKCMNPFQMAKMETESHAPEADVESVTLGEFLPLRTQHIKGKLITAITIPVNVKLAFQYISRTPADKPIVCAALAQWNSGRTRLALGGYGKSPLLAMDGTETEGLETAARNAFHEANDEWASAAYRMDVASTLAKRCL